MFYALVDNVKSSASTTGLQGICPLCNTEVFSKCGDERLWHWAHKKKDCDSWHEPETEWHKEWKSRFPLENVEVVINKNGKIHRADILTTSGICIEIQNSPISARVIAEREDFYRKIIWVVNAEKFKSGLMYEYDCERKLCWHYLPEFIEDYKPVGFKPFSAYIYKSALDPIISEIISTCGFQKETYTGAYYLSLFNLSNQEAFGKERKYSTFYEGKAFTNSILHNWKV